MPLSTHIHNSHGARPSSNQPRTINFRGRSSSSEATSSPTISQIEEQAGPSTSEPSYPAQLNESRSHVPYRRSLALARLVPARPDTGILDISDNDENADTGTPVGNPRPSGLVVVIQPDQSGHIEGATLITIPPDLAAESISDYGESLQEIGGLSSRALWLLRIGGFIAGTAFLFPGVAILSAADQLEQETYPQNMAGSRILGGTMTGIGAGLDGLAIFSIVNACIPNILSRVATLARSRWTPSGPASDVEDQDDPQRQEIQLPAANLYTLA